MPYQLSHNTRQEQGIQELDDEFFNVHTARPFQVCEPLEHQGHREHADQVATGRQEQTYSPVSTWKYTR
eukprot:m.321319 g.321319  ORF g.321319 m.321319 type:complete len:69 (-) comp20332_c0_seq2:1025-1231(-)